MIPQLHCHVDGLRAWDVIFLSFVLLHTLQHVSGTSETRLPPHQYTMAEVNVRHPVLYEIPGVCLPTAQYESVTNAADNASHPAPSHHPLLSS